MKLNELQAILDDKLMMARIYDAIETSAKINSLTCEFLYTDVYPNRHNSIINVQQVEQLQRDGYTVTEEVRHGSLIYVVSGWKVNK
ncbi:hypothetical protein PHABIO_157 [Pseudomonas phage Phabio]|uniref:Uncharacterized protein n=1 Tax=Pseudomonas phage Phabio TaxID=2006668 RepID=A0A1Y0SZY0_9CAUD|nr:hypothetical protein MZD05_gp157 [Pseudomonas phage Phabio]ARV76788.1 hypothetical protein PHABIO_157 [Pseudomonas phage Phabio]